VRDQHGGRVPGFSPDGRWWWNGYEWMAASRQSPLQPTRAPAQAPRRLPHQSRRFWIVAGSIVGALALMGAFNAAVSNRPGTGAAQRAATAPTPTSDIALNTPTPTSSPTPAPTPTVAASARPASTTVPPRQRKAAAPPAAPPPHAADQRPPQQAPPPPPPPPNTCGAPPNPWGYNFCGGTLIPSPNSAFCSYFDCIPSF
jgi:hypothetical protein